MSWQKHLGKLEEGISVSIPLDEDGYLDRECPSEQCASTFYVFVEACEQTLNRCEGQF